MTGLQFTVGAEHAPILDAALTPILRRYRECGMRAPVDIEELAIWARLVTRGLSSPLEVDLSDDAVVPVLLTLPQAAELIGCSLTKLKKLVADGKVRTVDFDGVRRVHRDDLEDFLQSLRSGGRLVDRLEVKVHAPARNPNGVPGRRRLPDTLEAS